MEFSSSNWWLDWLLVRTSHTLGSECVFVKRKSHSLRNQLSLSHFIANIVSILAVTCNVPNIMVSTLIYKVTDGNMLHFLKNSYIFALERFRVLKFSVYLLEIFTCIIQKLGYLVLKRQLQ